LLAVSLQVMLVLDYSDRPNAPLAAVDKQVAQHTHSGIAWTLEMVTASLVSQRSRLTAVTSKCTHPYLHWLKACSIESMQCCHTVALKVFQVLPCKHNIECSVLLVCCILEVEGVRKNVGGAMLCILRVLHRRL